MTVSNVIDLNKFKEYILCGKRIFLSHEQKRARLCFRIYEKNKIKKEAKKGK